MPFYKYKCENKSCNWASDVVKRSISERDNEFLCKECGNQCRRLIGSPLGSIITEQPTKEAQYRGKSVKKGINAELRKRAHRHFMEHEMDDLIEQHGVKHAKNVGWLDPKTGKKRKLIDEK